MLKCILCRTAYLLQDQALSFISEELGLELKDTTMDMLGRAKSVKVQKENTVIVDGEGAKEDIDAEKLHRLRHSLRRQLLNLIKRSYRKDLLSLQVV